jgi:hypothetical protein
MTEGTGGVAAIYRERLREREGRLLALRQRDGWIANSRLVVAVVGVIGVWPTLFSAVVPAWWLLFPAVAFAALAVAHAAIIRKRDLAVRAVRFYEAGLERLENRWQGQGRDGARFLDLEHPYAQDLDILGEGSLFELVSTARTSPGEAALAGWLLEPAGAPEVEARQLAVAELCERLDLREELALIGEDVPSAVHPDDLVAWAQAPPAITSSWPSRLAWAAAAVNVAAVVAWWRLPYGSLPLVPALLLGGGVSLALRKKVGEVLARAGRPQRELSLWAAMLRLFERQEFSAPKLVEIQADLRRTGVASRRIADLARLVEWSESRRNVLFAPIAGLLLLGTQLAWAIERWRRDFGAEVGDWIEAMGELEALSSLASLAYERPGDSFPEVVEGGVFEARALGHPLLPAADCVRNDVSLGPEPRLLLVSGSNMSGKSTLLRSVGVNVVLALAGASVRAESLRLGVLTVGASLRTVDSLQDGTSRFYAEIKRLRLISELAGGEAPLLFLLDEILAGTNSHDRRIGAEGVIRSLLASGGLGLVTTHDLALAEIADALDPLALNVHFEDRLDDGKMLFDYRLREGLVEKSNALDLMRGLGLDV